MTRNIAVVALAFTGIATWTPTDAIGLARLAVSTIQVFVRYAWSGRRSIMYRIREADGQDEDVSEVLADLHRRTFFNGAPVPDFGQGHWWLAFYGKIPIAFAGIVTSTRVRNAGYFSRVGVLKKHCGNALQLRLMRAMEPRARNNRWHFIVSDTTDNVPSANNFILAGYRLFRPRCPWAWPNSLYWRKSIDG